MPSNGGELNRISINTVMVTDNASQAAYRSTPIGQVHTPELTARWFSPGQTAVRELHLPSCWSGYSGDGLAMHMTLPDRALA